MDIAEATDWELVGAAEEIRGAAQNVPQRHKPENQTFLQSLQQQYRDIMAELTTRWGDDSVHFNRQYRDLCMNIDEDKALLQDAMLSLGAVVQSRYQRFSNPAEVIRSYRYGDDVSPTKRYVFVRRLKGLEIDIISSASMVREFVLSPTIDAVFNQTNDCFERGLVTLDDESHFRPAVLSNPPDNIDLFEKLLSLKGGVFYHSGFDDYFDTVPTKFPLVATGDSDVIDPYERAVCFGKSHSNGIFYEFSPDEMGAVRVVSDMAPKYAKPGALVPHRSELYRIG